ncbi:hypothetical protein OH492_25140 [Vibrio chagasii]|nr:hypothetical protein [Vibrio chagasii]
MDGGTEHDITVTINGDQRCAGHRTGDGVMRAK